MSSTQKQEGSNSWLRNSVIQRELRLTIKDKGDNKPEETRGLTDSDVNKIVAICDQVLR